jgi:RND family efflux transporter MFP subunit
MIRNILLSIISALLLFSCNNKRNEENLNEKDTTDVADIAPIEVETAIAKRGIFYNEITSNGKLSASEKVDIQFSGSGKIIKISVKNGQVVTPGTVLAELDNYELKMKLHQTQTSWNKAKIELTDVLISQGYNLRDSLNISKEILEIAKIRSGFAQAESDYELALYNYNQSVVKSPISGVVANLSAKELNYCKSTDPLCSILGTKLEAGFAVLESELASVKNGQEVEVSPYFDNEHKVKGIISEINPLVDKNGLVSIKAIIKEFNPRLLEGMNIKVWVKNEIPGKIIVPKNAITLRSEKKVVFTYSCGKAMWNYVKIGLENSNFCTIDEGINEGDTIIVSGNLHLGHEAPVKIIEPKHLLSNK